MLGAVTHRARRRLLPSWRAATLLGRHLPPRWKFANATPATPLRGIGASRQLSVASAANYDVVHHSHDGLLVGNSSSSSSTSSPSPSPTLMRGSLIEHEGVKWVCVFQVDGFWFATPSQTANAAMPSDQSSIQCLQRPTPLQAERAQLADCVPTGIIAVDTLAPIGLGQSMLVCGPRGSGKSLLAREVIEQALSSGRFEKVIRFQDCGSAPSIDPSLQSSGAFLDLIADISDTKSSLLQLFAAVDAAEAVRDAGNHAVLVLDTASPLLSAWKLAASRAEAVRGEPADSELIAAQRRSVFANILERASSLTSGGSLTLVILVETEAMGAIHTPAAASAGVSKRTSSSVDAGTSYRLEEFAGRKETEFKRLEGMLNRGIQLTDATLKAVGIAAPQGSQRKSDDCLGSAAVRELQSLSDGQLVLTAQDNDAGEQWLPAVEPGTSFSRFGLGSASSGGDQAPGKAKPGRDVRPPALQAVAAHLRVHLALEREAHFRPAAGGADSVQSVRMAAVTEALRQPPRAALRPEEMTVLLLAACSGALDDLPIQQAAAALRGGATAPLLRHIREVAPGVLDRVAREGRLERNVARELDVAVRLFAALRQADAASGSPTAEATPTAAAAAVAAEVA